MKSAAAIKKLIDSHKNLIESEASKYAQFVPLYVVQAEAYKLAHKAAEEYDEKSGNKFSTFLHNSLKKLSRISTKYGGTVRIPEGSQFKLHRLNQVEASLKNELGREPTLDELSLHSGFSLHEVSHLLSARKKDVNINNVAYTPVFLEDSSDEWLHFVYHDLNQRDRFIMEHKTGFGGKTVMSNDELAKALHISTSTVANRVKLISERIAQGL